MRAWSNHTSGLLWDVVAMLCVVMSGCPLFWSMIVWQVEGSVKPQLPGLGSCPVSLSACNSLLLFIRPRRPFSDITINECWGKNQTPTRCGTSITSPLAVTSIHDIKLNSHSLSRDIHTTHEMHSGSAETFKINPFAWSGLWVSRL